MLRVGAQSGMHMLRIYSLNCRNDGVDAVLWIYRCILSVGTHRCYCGCGTPAGCSKLLPWPCVKSSRCTTVPCMGPSCSSRAWHAHSEQGNRDTVRALADQKRSFYVHTREECDCRACVMPVLDIFGGVRAFLVDCCPLLQRPCHASVKRGAVTLY
jgi:hypothetical protein